MSDDHHHNDNYNTYDHEDTSVPFENEDDAMMNMTAGSSSSYRERLQVADKENRAVWCLRILVLTLLMGVALSICLTVYFISRQSETDDFERGFEEMSLKVLEGFEATLKQRLGILQSLSMDLTAYEKNTPNVSFPFVTLPDYEKRAGHVGKLADVMSAAFFPLITEDQREEFDAYATANQDWLAQGISYRTRQPLDEVRDSLQPIASSVWGIYPDSAPAVETRPGPYWVHWQGFPASPQLPVLMNVGNHPHYMASLAYLLRNKQPVFPPSYDFMDPASHESDPRRPMIQGFLESYESYGTGVQYLDDPVMPLLYPVCKEEEEGQEEVVVATLICGVYWRTYFQHLLPRGANGVRVVLHNTCGQEYTYRVDGAEAQFVGHGDLHDVQYDYLATTTNSRDAAAGIDHSTSTGSCLYGIRVYPSREFEETYMTQKPLLYTLVLAAVFLFTSLAFILYDYCVERRQQLVLKSATQSGALVSSLFPEVVRHRLYEEQEQQQQQQLMNGSQRIMWKNNTSTSSSTADNKNNHASSSSSLSNTAKSTTASSEQQSRCRHHSAIANLYPECTVLFADIVGFTQWSSNRSPTEVFQLLETIYESFDRVAQKRSVFKVETIGDCYVAVTGIPHAQPDHAVRMVKFAQDCMHSLRDMINHGCLQAKLGDADDTNQLAMRFGLHSGPVTAGVLRGEKSRFQIFGDTVNTAARMESNGLPRRIQVSEATATLLKESGKGDWTTPRADLVSAKGKGTLQTYWVSSTRTRSPKTSTGIMGDSSMDYSATTTTPHCCGKQRDAIRRDHHPAATAA